ncbi:MAG: hypothetical protein V3W41_08385 [Planctomycetota bacterium]
MMNTLGLLLFFLFAASLAAQEKAPSEFTVDRAGGGLWEWKVFKAHKCEHCPDNSKFPKFCLECKKKKKKNCATCKPLKHLKPCCTKCAGSKKVTKDPVRNLACPQCNAKKATPCPFCKGGGVVSVVGGSSGGNKCFCCNGKGVFRCSLCRGKCFVPFPKVNGNDFRKARRLAIERHLKGLKAAEVTLGSLGDRGVTDTKTTDIYAKVAKKVRTVLPAASVQAKGLKSIMKNLARAQQYENYSARFEAVMDTHQSAISELLDENIRLTELALKRLLHNERIKAESSKE